MVMEDNRLDEKKPKKAYKELTLEEKVMLIKQAQANPHCSQATLARQYGIAKSNACRILKRRNEYLTAYASANFGGDRKRKMRHVDTRELDTRIQKWIEECFATGKPIFGSQIQEKAKEISAELNLTNFTPNSAWLNNFQKAYFSCSSPALSEDSGNETLRAHMYKQHSISRMFMCRCCNWAFPDKTSMHIHMQAMASGNPGNVSIIAKSSASPYPPSNSANSSSGGSGSNSLRPPMSMHQSGSNGHLETSPHHPMSALGLNMPTNFMGSSPLFPGMAARDELFQRLKERALLNGAQMAAAQAGMGLAAWLSHFPKVDASGVGNLGGTLSLKYDENDEQDNNTMVVVGESASPVSDTNNDTSEMAEMIEDDGQDDLNGSDIDVEHSHMEQHNHYNDTKPNIDELNKMLAAAQSNGGGSIQDTVISQSPSSTSDPSSEQAEGSKDMPALRSAIASSPLDSLLYQKKLNGVLRHQPSINANDDDDNYEPEAKRANSRDSHMKDMLHTNQNEVFGVSTSTANEESSSYASPTETHSVSSHNSNSSPSSHGSPKQVDCQALSNGPPASLAHQFPFLFGNQQQQQFSQPLQQQQHGMPVMNCFGCQIVRAKFGLSENRNRFLEAKVTSLESKVGRLESRIATLDGNSRRYEFEGKSLREQSDILQRKLLDCQERALSFLQQSSLRSDPTAVQKFVTHILHTANLANQ